ncbi:MAG: Rieske 2Fe-2S domain-containing protein [Hyphomicrobiaceae bacterium]|nr:Rieske 2Fe-2S domain-containing protein [Hyphomicrobiaceae bacterium]
MSLTRLCALADLGPDKITRVEVEGRSPVALALADGGAVAFDDTCPHADESLSQGWVEDGRIVCAVHFAEFEIGSGKAHNAPIGCGRLRFYPTEIRDGAVHADLAD